MSPPLPTSYRARKMSAYVGHWARSPGSLVLTPYSFILKLDIEDKLRWHSHCLSHVTALWDPPVLEVFTVKTAQCRVKCVGFGARCGCVTLSK